MLERIARQAKAHLPLDQYMQDSPEHREEGGEHFCILAH
jgi:hypothetical protein